jgi:hypothetical protein
MMQLGQVVENVEIDGHNLSAILEKHKIKDNKNNDIIEM